MTVRLRPHHLLCVLTYVGRGYSPAFTANYDALVDRLAAGEAILIVDGPDDICGPVMATDDPHCLKESVVERDRLAANDVAALIGAPIEPGLQIALDERVLPAMRKAFAGGTVRAACTGCEWSQLCSAVASIGFRDTRL